MCRCRPEVRTPCCGQDSCHVAGNITREECPWCNVPKRPPTQRDEDMFADVVKGALERGIDVPKIIADILKKGKPNG